ncbi:MAG: DUF2335 domain-containing protein [Chloroflexi bacterium]|nr:DUF2335 domain-containing protein [Chloroflexota bacterium]
MPNLCADDEADSGQAEFGLSSADTPDLQIQETTIAWQGPLPPPGALQAYDDVIPGAADRILKMAEDQAAHRIQMDRLAVHSEIRSSLWGVTAGFLLSAGVIGGGIYLIATGHDWAGSMLIGFDLATLAGIFVYGTRSRLAERNRKSNQ